MNVRATLLIRLLAACLFLTGLPVLAAPSLAGLDTLYTVNIPVINQGDDERRRALREGMVQILLRLSGQQEVSANPVVQQALVNAEKQLLEFRYNPLGEAEKAALKLSLEAEQRRLARSKTQARLLSVQVPTHRIQARFSPDAVKALIERAGLPFWPARRPSVLVWAVVDDGAGLKLLSQFPAEQKAFRDEAVRRGLSLVWPMQDLTDQVALPPQRLMALEDVAVREASARYGEAAVLAGRFKQLPDNTWQANWLFITADGSASFEVTADDLQSLLTAGVEASIQQLLQRYAIPAQSPVETVMLQVDGIDNLPRYATALRLLQNIESVRSVVVSQVNTNSLQLSVATAGGSAIFKNLLALEDHLKPVTMPETTVVDPAAPLSLHYRFND